MPTEDLLQLLGMHEHLRPLSLQHVGANMLSWKPSSIELLPYHGTLVHLPIHLLLHTPLERHEHVVPASIRKCLHYLSRLLGGLGFLARQHNLGQSVARDIDHYSVWVCTPVSSACR
jgi:hypothetical protein